MKKPIYKPGGMRMVIDTGHKTFDHYCDLVTTGNVCSNVQTSSFIRAYSDVECNGRISPPGHLRDFDLEPFRRLPHHVRQYIESVTMDEGAILYQFGHPRSDGHYQVDGFIITSRDYHFLRQFVINPRGGQRILDTVAPYICKPVA